MNFSTPTTVEATSGEHSFGDDTLSLESIFSDIPDTIAEDLLILERSATNLEHDPEFQSSCIKSRFVAAITGAMDKKGITQTALAAKWGRTKQYLNKILNEDNRVNFTIETMVQLTMLLEHKLEVHVVDRSEGFTVMYVHKNPEREVGAYRPENKTLEFQSCVFQPLANYNTHVYSCHG